MKQNMVIYNLRKILKSQGNPDFLYKNLFMFVHQYIKIDIL